jgi:4,5-DOPA dioxygenase extradiol
MTQNRYTEAWSRLTQQFERPRAILCISAHWYIPRLQITGSPNPKTIHDFHGFPETLFKLDYPAPGAPELADTLAKQLSPWEASVDLAWGLDHGAWTLLRHLYPEADIPVLELSLNHAESPDWHYQLGQALRPLREEGILILGSGNIVHNLSLYDWGHPERAPYPWADRFEKQVIDWILEKKHRSLIDCMSRDPDARLAIPTPEHYLPLLTVLGTAHEEDGISFPIEGSEGGSISMLSVQLGG